MSVNWWVRVSFVTPWVGLRSQVIVVLGSAAVVGSIGIRQVCTSRCGGSVLSTSPSMITSGQGQPISAEALLMASEPVEWNRPPGWNSKNRGAA